MSHRKLARYLLLQFLLVSCLAKSTNHDSSLGICAASLNATAIGPTPRDFSFSGIVRYYYIAAEEITWDYAPTGFDNWLGVPFAESPRAQAANYTVHGTKWRKALYRGYTDANFSSLSPQPPWQGVQGPTIRAEVGDVIRILFVNRLSQNYASMHSKGLVYSKESEGTTYANNTAPDQESPRATQDGVPPGGCTVYTWLVNDASAPPVSQPSVLKGYESFVAPEEDFNSGLLGPTIIYQRGMMNLTMASYREIPLLFMPFDESDSFMSKINAQRLTSNASSMKSGFPNSVNGSFSHNQTIYNPQLTNLLSSGYLDDAPTFYSLNGYVFANNPIFHICLNEQVIWYVYAQGTEPHVFHPHGNPFTYQDIAYASLAVNPGEMTTMHMNAVNAGLWQVICHMSDHMTKGMVALYWVHSTNCPVPSLSTR